MADIGGLAKAMDLSNTNLYGADTDRLQELRDAQSKAIEALQHRYDHPNWFKVAAGFAKPQLGGFVASLGSASDALGDWVEEKRQNQIPVSQLELTKAQTNMLLGNEAKAADIVTKAKTENRQLTPAEIQEITNLSPKRGEMLLKSQSGRAAEVANNIAITKQNYQARGEPMPPLNEMGLPDTGKYPTGANSGTGGGAGGGGSGVIPDNVAGGDKGPTVNAQEGQGAVVPNKGGIEANIGGDNAGRTLPSAVPPAAPAPQAQPQTKNIYVLPNGARASEDVYALHKAGVPIISNIRTQEEQDALKDHQDANGNWYTKQGLPVAANGGKHLSGDAMDIDTKKLTDDQKKLLDDKGWHQPAWATNPKSSQYDPNHWERDTTGAQAPAQTAQVKKPEDTTKQPSKREVIVSNWRDASPINPYTNQEAGIKETQAYLNGQGKTYADGLNATGSNQVHANVMRPISNLESEAQDPRFDQVMGIFGGKGLLSGLAQLVQGGVNVNLADFNAQVGVNLQKIAQASLPAEVVPFAQEVYRNLAQMALNNQKSAGVSPSTARNAELGILADASAHPETSPAAARLYIRQSNLAQRMNRDLYLDHQKLITNTHPDFVLDSKSPVPLYDASRAKSQQSIIDDYNQALENEVKKFREQTAAKKKGANNG